MTKLLVASVVALSCLSLSACTSVFGNKATTTTSAPTVSVEDNLRARLTKTGIKNVKDVAYQGNDEVLRFTVGSCKGEVSLLRGDMAHKVKVDGPKGEDSISHNFNIGSEDSLSTAQIREITEMCEV